MTRPSRQSKTPMPPDDGALAALLGKAKAHWDALLAAAVEADASCTVEWVYYKSLKGWRCIVKRGKRSVVHLRPDDGGFLASFAMSDGAIDAAVGLGVPASVVAEARAAKVLPEGRPVRVDVKTVKDLRAAVGLVRAEVEAGR